MLQPISLNMSSTPYPHSRCYSKCNSRTIF